jgi:cystathionine beta-lyase family protein involved in aluminum resistance
VKTNEEIENAIRNYHWLIKEIARLKGELGMIGNPLMNKNEPGQQKHGRPTNPTLNEVIRRETRLETLKKFQEKVEYVEKNTLVIVDDREMTVLNCLLDGMNISNISRHMGYSKRTIYSIKEEIVEKVKAHAEGQEQPSA